MDKEFKRLPDLELEVMLAIWNSGELLHTGEIAQKLGGAKRRPLQAIQTVLARLGEKGFVRCEKIGRLNYYHPAVSKEDYRASETKTFIEKLYGNSPTKLMAALAQSGGLSDEDLCEIMRILEKGDAK